MPDIQNLLEVTSEIDERMNMLDPDKVLMVETTTDGSTDVTTSFDQNGDEVFTVGADGTAVALSDGVFLRLDGIPCGTHVYGNTDTKVGTGYADNNKDGIKDKDQVDDIDHDGDGYIDQDLGDDWFDSGTTTGLMAANQFQSITDSQSQTVAAKTEQENRIKQQIKRVLSQ